MEKCFYLIVIFCFALSTKGQDRISNILNVEETFMLHRNIAKIDDEEYLIEQNLEFTKISRLNLDDVEHLYTLMYRPQNQKKLYISDHCLQSLPLTYKQNQLVEIYSNSVFLTDILTGELLKTINIGQDSLQIVSKEGLMLGQSLVLIAQYTTNQNKIILVNLETYDVTVMPRNFSKSVYRIDEFVYEYQGAHLTRYNLLDQVTDTLTTIDDVFNFVWTFSRNSKTHLIFGTIEGDIYHLDHEHQISKLDCNVKNRLREGYIKDSVLLITYFDGIYYVSDLIDLTNCEKLYHSRFLIAYDIPEIGSNKLLLSKFGGPFDAGTHMVFETNTHKLDTLDVRSDVDYFYEKKRFYHEGKLYIGAFNDSENGFEPATVWIIDDHDLVPKKVELQVDYTTLNIVFNSFNRGELKIVTERSLNYADLLTLKVEDNIANHLTSLIRNKNEGILKVTDTFKFKSDIFISSYGGIYRLQNGVFTNVYSCINCSRFALYDDHIFALCLKDEGVYGYIKLSLSDYSVQFFALEDLKSIHILGVADFGILIGTDVFSMEPTYFDLKSESLISILHNNIRLSPYSVHVSDQYILFKSRVDFQNRIFIFNTATNTNEIITLDDSQIKHIYPAENGTFFFIRIRNGKKEVLKRTHQGVITIVYRSDNSNQCSSGVKNEQTTFYVFGEDEVVFISQKDDVVEKNHIPHFTKNHTLCDLYWKSQDDMILVESRNEDDTYSVYVWRLGETPTLIPIPLVDYRVTEALIDKNDVILILHSNLHPTSLIVHYSYASNTILDVKEMPKTMAHHIIDFTKLNEDEYLLSYNDGRVGSEPWIYNKANHTFELLKDIYPDFLSSDPAHFMSLEDFVYFSAVDIDKGRQWFTYKPESTSLKPLFDHSSSLTVMPNPTSNTIRLLSSDTIEQNIFTISIYNIYGILISTKSQLLNDVNDISDYPSGIYYITCSDGVKVLNTRFLKI